MKKRPTARIVVALVLLLIVAGFIALQYGAWAGEAQTTMEQDISDISSEVLESDTTLSMSSNPYDYANASPAVERLVAKGTPALPVIEQAIAESPDNGLVEYVLAIAAQRIAKVELGATQDDPLLWETGKGWTLSWHRHLEAVPGEVERLSSSDMSGAEMNAALVRLGTPALPYILDEIARGNREIVPAAEALADGMVELEGETAPRVTPAWAKANSDRFDQLRSMVEESTLD